MFSQLDLKASEEENISLKKQIKDLQEENCKEGEISKETIASLRQENERLKEDVETSKWQLETETKAKVQEIKDLRRALVSNWEVLLLYCVNIYKL